DVSLLDTVTALLTNQAERVLAAGERPTRLGNRHASIAPYDTFDVADGVLVLAIGNDTQWQKFCAALGLDALGADARYLSNAGRVHAYDELRARLAATLRPMSRDPLVARLRAAG